MSLDQLDKARGAFRNDDPPDEWIDEEAEGSPRATCQEVIKAILDRLAEAEARIATLQGRSKIDGVALEKAMARIDGVWAVVRPINTMIENLAANVAVHGLRFDSMDATIEQMRRVDYEWAGRATRTFQHVNKLEERVGLQDSTLASAAIVTAQLANRVEALAEMNGANLANDCSDLLDILKDVANHICPEDFDKLQPPAQLTLSELGRRPKAH